MKKGRMVKNKLLFRQILGVFCFLGGFCVLIVAEVLQHHGVEPNGILFMGGFLVLMGAALALLLSTLSAEISLEAEAKYEKYGNQPLTQLPNLSKQRIVHILRDAGFQEEDGLWHKRQFSWTKGGCIIHNYVCFAPRDDDMEWLLRFDEGKFRFKNLCILVFLCRDEVTSKDESDLRTVAIHFFLDETLIPTSTAHALIPILMDEGTQNSEFLEISQRMSIYAYGCRLLRELFS